MADSNSPAANCETPPARPDRRRFLQKTVAAAPVVAIPYFYSSCPSLAFDTGSANDKVPIGLIGAGGMGIGNMRSASKWLDVVAIADVDSSHLRSANKQLSDGKAAVFDDYRKILDRDDIRVVHIATPDHWHAKPLIEAMLAGKDVYCEKPLTLTIDEGKLVRKVQKQTGRIVQVGTQQRSQFGLFTKIIAMVDQGRVGKIKRMVASIGGSPVSPELPEVKAPQTLDWDRWLGPAPADKFRFLENKTKGAARAFSNGHYEFRWWYEYSGGKLTDWGAHHVDIAAWALRENGQSDAVVSVEGTAEHPVDFKDGVPQQRGRYNTATRFNLIVKFAGGAVLEIKHGPDNGVLIEGDRGRVFVNRRKLTGKPAEELSKKPLPADAVKKVYKGFDLVSSGRKGHWANFLAAVDQKKEPVSDVHSHMRALNICHLAGICARLGRKISWDDSSEQIVGDDVANAMLKRDYRSGYEIEM